MEIFEMDLYGSIGPRREIFETSCTPIPMVPRLHQRNGYMEGKQHEWATQMCFTLVDTENALAIAGRKSTPLHGGRYRT